MTEPPIIESRQPNEAEERLAALMNDLEKGQLEFLDAAGKRIIELTTALLGVLFAVIAFGDDFPPPYLARDDAKILTVLALAAYLGALFFALFSVQPRSYNKYDFNLTKMRAELDKITAYKSRTLRMSGGLFFIGSAALAVMIGVLVMSA